MVLPVCCNNCTCLLHGYQLKSYSIMLFFFVFIDYVANIKINNQLNIFIFTFICHMFRLIALMLGNLKNYDCIICVHLMFSWLQKLATLTGHSTSQNRYISFTNILLLLIMGWTLNYVSLLSMINISSGVNLKIIYESTKTLLSLIIFLITR